MARCLQAPSHYLIQCWKGINMVPGDMYSARWILCWLRQVVCIHLVCYNLMSFDVAIQLLQSQYDSSSSLRYQVQMMFNAYLLAHLQTVFLIDLYCCIWLVCCVWCWFAYILIYVCCCLFHFWCCDCIHECSELFSVHICDAIYHDHVTYMIDLMMMVSACATHYCDVIMGAMASQITSLTIVYWTVYSDADQRKHQSSVSLAFVRWPVNSPHKWPVTRKMFPLDDVIMSLANIIRCKSNSSSL